MTCILYNHNNFKYFITTKSLFIYQAQYTKKLAKFNFEIKYKLGKVNPTNVLFWRLDYAKGFKDSSKRIVFNVMLPILQQKLQVIGLIGGPGATILYQRVVYVQYTSNLYKLGAGGLERPAILSKTTLISLIALNPREDPLAQATVPHNNLASHLRIIYYFTSTDFAQSLVPQQEIVVVVLAETAFIEYPLKSLVNFIRGV